MKKILLLMSFFYSFSTLAQEQLEVNVNDLLTHKPVRSVEVYIESIGEKSQFGITDKF